MNQISQQSIDVFFDLLSKYSTVREIESMFRAEGIFENEDHISFYSGVRRETADKFVSSLDVENPNDISKLLRVMESVMISLEARSDSYFYDIEQDPMVNEFIALMKRDGFHWSNGRFKVGEDTSLDQTKDIEKFGIPTVNKELNRALEQLHKDPEDSITAARSLIESTLKWILDQEEIKYDSKGDLSPLYKKVAKILMLSPDQHNEQIFKQILGSVSGVVQGLGSLRNAYGDSHGKGKDYGSPSVRHAKLSIGLSGSICIFLLETYEKRKSSSHENSEKMSIS